jgi:hypothetical protein
MTAGGRIGADIPPAKAENDAWFSYRAVAQKQGREVDERTFRDAWRQGCHFTFGATSQLSPAIAAFIGWMEYVTDWSLPRGEAVGNEEATEPTRAGS